jgi:hypothetical protein
MDMKSIFGGVSIGKETSGNIKPSVKGLAVRVGDGSFMARQGDGLFDVGGFVFDGGERFVFRVPVSAQQIEPGDLLILSDTPFRALFVRAVRDGIVHGLDPQSSSNIEYVPPSNLFGVNFFVKAVSLIANLGTGDGIDLMPLLLLSDGNGSSGGGSGDDGLMTLLMLQGLTGGSSPDMAKLLPLLILKGAGGGGLESLLLMQALGLNLGALASGPLVPLPKAGLRQALKGKSASASAQK